MLWTNTLAYITAAPKKNDLEQYLRKRQKDTKWSNLRCWMPQPIQKLLYKLEIMLWTNTPAYFATAPKKNDLEQYLRIRQNDTKWSILWCQMPKPLQKLLYMLEIMLWNTLAYFTAAPKKNDLEQYLQISGASYGAECQSHYTNYYTSLK